LPFGSKEHPEDFIFSSDVGFVYAFIFKKDFFEGLVE
jgi:hypothetical protein